MEVPTASMEIASSTVPTRPGISSGYKAMAASVPKTMNGRATVQRLGYPNPADCSGEGDFQAVRQPVWLQEQRIIGRRQVCASGLANGLR